MKDQLQQIDHYLAIHEIKKADILIAKLLRQNPLPQNRAEILLRRARTRLLAARPDDAIDDLVTIRDELPGYIEPPVILELQGDCHFARFELASVGFADRNDTILARQFYEAVIDSYPPYNNLGWVYYQLARIFVSLGQVDDASDLFQKALVSPSYINVLTAYCYERLGFLAFYEYRDFDRALAFLNRALDTYPGAAERGWLANLHLLQSRVLKARSDYAAALKAAEMAATIFSSLGDRKSALSDALLTSAELLAELHGHDREVISTLQHYMQITRKPLGVDVTWSRVNEMMGDAHFNIGQYENAIANYEAALQFNPDHPWEETLYYRIAWSYYQRHDYQNVVQTIRQMMASAKMNDQTITDYHVYDMLGNALFALKQYEKAVEAYGNALDIAPPNSNTVEKIKSYYNLARERA
jgi:tetratricopeptide (TPR) repeat protein